MVAQQQNALAAWTRLPDSRLPSGALNMTRPTTRDVRAGPGRQRQPRGPVGPRASPNQGVGQAYSASGWLQLGGAIDPTGLYVTRFPRGAGHEARRVLRLLRATSSRYDDITHVQPLSDLFVVRWSH